MAVEFTNKSFRVGRGENTISKIDPTIRQQLISDMCRITDLIQSLYSIVLFDMSKLDAIEDVALDPSKTRKAAEFFFTVPPKVHEMKEPFATNIVMTQNGGKFIESQGSILKEVRLQGTTGLRPNRNSPANISLLNLSLDASANISSAVNAVQGLGAGGSNLIGADLTFGQRKIKQGEVIGHDDIIFLRNIFRKYSDLKQNDQFASKVVLLWRNLKDSDFWIVEPTEFTLSQNSSSPLTYEYSIGFKTIAKFDQRFEIGEDPQQLMKDVRRTFARVQEYGRVFTNSFFVISTQIDRISQVGFNVGSLVLTPLVQTINGLNAIKSSSLSFKQNFKQGLKRLSNNLKEAIEKLKDKVPAQDPVLRSLRRSYLTTQAVLTEPALRESVANQYQDRRDRFVSAYLTPGDSVQNTQTATASGTSSFLGNEPIPTGVGQDFVQVGENIRSAAKRLLGDASRWHVLAVLNNLKSPFIAPTSSEGVLAFGDPILFPLSGDRAVNTTQVQSPQALDSSTLSPIEASYGKDILLKEGVENQDVPLNDLVVSQRGDLEVVSGKNNVSQAVKLRLSVERGQLISHPSYGTRYPLGKKLTPSSFAGFRISIENSVLSDDRVQDVPDLQIASSGDTIVCKLRVRLKDSSEISTLFALLK